MTTPLGLGLVGYGDFGRFTAEVYATLPQLSIVAVTDTDATRREDAARRYSARAYATLEQLLTDELVDLVVISTPPWLHVPQAMASAKAGKHIFLEKPLATTLEDADRLLETVEASGVRLSIDYVLRHVPIYTTLQQIIKSQLLGPLTYMRLENLASHENLAPHHWFWDRSRSGGIFIEHGVHFFDLCNQLSASQPLMVSGYAHTTTDGRQDRIMASVSYENGTLAHFYHAFDRPAILEQTVLRIVMERGTATAYGWIPERLEVEGNLPEQTYSQLAEILATPLEEVTLPPPPGITGATAGKLVRATITRPDRTTDYLQAVRTGMSDFITSIHNSSHIPKVTIRNSYDSFRLAFAAQRSIDEGHSMPF